jgi:hypothetical protein
VLAIDLVLQSLSDSFNQFLMNTIMNEIEKMLPKLLNVFRTTEQDINKGEDKVMLMV